MLKAARGPEFVELAIKENNSRVRLLLKALIPSKDAHTPAFAGRRGGSHLFESLGMDIGGRAGKGDGIDPLMLTESGLYLKHEEEIDLVNSTEKITK